MSGKEIGLMQIRTGKQRNLPKALEHGELALTTDECRMFAGLPSAVTPASLVAGRTAASVPGSSWENVEILTEFTPAHVLNRVLFKPVKVTITPSVIENGLPTTFTTINIPSADRVFVDYIAYSNDGTILESGTFNVVSIGGTPLVSQNSNTNETDGVHQLEVQENAVAVDGGIITVPFSNIDDQTYSLEYIYRGWTAPL